MDAASCVVEHLECAPDAVRATFGNPAETVTIALLTYSASSDGSNLPYISLYSSHAYVLCVFAVKRCADGLTQDRDCPLAGH